MSSHTAEESRFAEDWMAWVALRHFLPPRSLRALLDTAVQDITEGRFALGDLFEERLEGVSAWAQVWLLRPRYGLDAAAARLQELVRFIVWQNDEFPSGAPDQARSDQLRSFEAAISVGILDFGGHLAAFVESCAELPLQPSFQVLLNSLALAAARPDTTKPAHFWDLVTPKLEELPSPLSAIATKHVADLCADADRWATALPGFRKAQTMLLPCSDDESWRDVTHVWSVLFKESEAAAASIVCEPAAGLEILESAMEGIDFSQDPLLVANVGADANALSWATRERPWAEHDRRVAVVPSTLLHHFHVPMPAVGYWLSGKYQDAHRRFWATLRRQIALGALTDAQRTKALRASHHR